MKVVNNKSGKKLKLSKIKVVKMKVIKNLMVVKNFSGKKHECGYQREWSKLKMVINEICG